MRLIIIFILAIYFNNVNGQSFTYPSINSTGQKIIDFAPPGWTILDSAYGDLNNDGIKDAAVVIQYRDSISMINSLEDTVLTQPRILLLFFKNASTQLFNLIEQSNSFILKHDNSHMDDPYQGIIIRNGNVEINFHLFYNMGSWYSTSSTYKFRFYKHSFALIGADISTIHRATLDYQDDSYNFLTNTSIHTTGNDQTGTRKTTRKKFHPSTLKIFKTFKEPYSWEIENDITL